MRPPLIRPLNRTDEVEIEVVAQRMRATLIEVLGEQDGRALYTMDWLRERVREHLDPKRYEAEVFLAEQAGVLQGQAIVRRDTSPEGGAIGLMATIYVLPEHRRAGIATALVEAVEQWIVDRKLRLAATNTGVQNERLIRLFEARGYAITARTDEMVQLTRVLP